MSKGKEWNHQQVLQEGFGRHQAQAVSTKSLDELIDAAEFALVTLDHAIELGYLGEGSTRGMAQDAIDKLKKAGIENPGDQ
jgi:hypothetical protein